MGNGTGRDGESVGGCFSFLGFFLSSSGSWDGSGISVVLGAEVTGIEGSWAETG